MGLAKTQNIKKRAEAFRAEKPPVCRWPDGSIRVGASRIPIERIVYAYNAGETPEEMNENFETLTLPEIYGTITYYLRHQEDVDRYISRRASEALIKRR